MFGWQTRRAQEHAKLMALLETMAQVQLAQAEVMQRFMKSYEITDSPSVRVMTDEREWEEEVERAIAKDQSTHPGHPLADALFAMSHE